MPRAGVRPAETGKANGCARPLVSDADNTQQRTGNFSQHGMSLTLEKTTGATEERAV
jgi:hypothetical protein